MNHLFSGIGLGTAFTRQGKFGAPFTFFPIIVPTNVSGNMTKHAMAINANIVVTRNRIYTCTLNVGNSHGMALEAWYEMATKLTIRAVDDTKNGNKNAPVIICLIHVTPPILLYNPPPTKPLIGERTA